MPTPSSTKLGHHLHTHTCPHTFFDKTGVSGIPAREVSFTPECQSLTLAFGLSFRILSSTRTLPSSDAACMRDLLGTQPLFVQSPPISLRSMRSVRAPNVLLSPVCVYIYTYVYVYHWFDCTQWEACARRMFCLVLCVCVFVCVCTLYSFRSSSLHCIHIFM
jgi:hypothetical protein